MIKEGVKAIKKFFSSEESAPIARWSFPAGKRCSLPKPAPVMFHRYWKA